MENDIGKSQTINAKKKMCWGIQGHMPTLPRSGLISRLLSRCTGLFYGGTVLHLSFWLHCYYFISKALLQLQHLLFFSYCKPPNSHLYTCSHMILLLLLSRFSRVRLCATPWTAAHPVLPTLGFSREEMECVAISFSNAWKWKGKVKSLSRARLLAIPWTAAYQAPPSMGPSRQE